MLLGKSIYGWVPCTTTAAPTTAAASTVPVETTDPPAPTTATSIPATEPALSQDGESGPLIGAESPRFWSPTVVSDTDPLVLIHTIPEIEVFFFSLELYATGYGQLWTGELGEVAVGCMESLPGANSTGICAYFDSDGPGPVELCSAFVATGSITINKLADTGYDIFVDEIVYPDGTPVGGFGMAGP